MNIYLIYTPNKTLVQMFATEVEANKFLAASLAGDLLYKERHCVVI